MVPETMISKADALVAKINTHPEYSDCVKREEFHSLREEAEKHSLDIELLNEGRKLSRKQRNVFLENLDNAWCLLSKEGVSLYTISRLGSMIEPKVNTTGGFRNTQHNFGGFWPTESEKIPYEVKNLVDFLNNTEIHPIIRASNAHLELVRIHPFEDGNGRSARLLQNFSLQQRSYPPAVIPSNERENYIRIMRNVLKDRYNHKSSVDNPSESEKIFQEYISSKVFDSATILEKALKSRRMYQIDLMNVRDVGISGTIAKKIRDIGRKNNNGNVSVCFGGKNGGKRTKTLEIIGDVSAQEVDSVLKSCADKYGVKYNIRNIYC